MSCRPRTKTSKMSRPAQPGLRQRFAEAWQRLAPRNVQTGVLVTVSGGVDSMVLAHLLASAGIRCAIAHVNFELRGDDSDGDEAFVRTWAESQGLPFHTTRFDTLTEATARRTGVQETARALRYAWFEEERARNGYSAILTAHHADDNAETFLLNLFRGAGLTGLGGIPESAGFLRRPLLSFQKEELRAYAATEGVTYRDDTSNASDQYLRNALRHRLFPVLDELFPNASGKLAATAVHLREAGQLYKDALQKKLHTLTDQRGADVYVPIRALRKAKPLTTLCYEIFSPAGFASPQLPQIIGLMEAETGRYVSSTTHRVIRHRDHLVITPTAAVGETAMMLVENFPAMLETSTHSYTFSEGVPPQGFSADPGVAWLDMAALQHPLVLRQTRAGDYFYPLGMERKKKKVARFLTSLKVPRHEKERAWVLESGGRIVWLAGYRIDERAKLTERTTMALRVERMPHSKPA